MRSVRFLVVTTALIALATTSGEAQSLDAVPSEGAAAPTATPGGSVAPPMVRLGAAAARFAPSSGERDSLWNGLLMGAAAGAGYGMVIAPPQFCGHSDSECTAIVRVAIGLPSIAGGAAIGALVDYLVHEDDAPSVNHGWRRVEVAPIAGRGVRGVQGRVRF